MLNKTIVVLTCLSWTVALPAITSGQNANGKVAVVDYSAVIRGCSEGKMTFAEFEKKVEAKRTEFEKRNNEILTLQRQLVEQAASLNPEAQRALSKSIESKGTQLKRDQEDAQKEFAEMQQEIVMRIATRLRPVVEKYAQEQGISVIVNSSTQDSQVFFVNPAIEISQEIIDLFDSTKASGSSPASE